MLRWGLRLILLAVPLFLVGFVGLWSVWFEVARLAGTAALTLGIGLLLVMLELLNEPVRTVPKFGT